MSHFQQIKEARPDLTDDEAIKEMADRLDNLQAFSVLMQSNEGKAYIEQKVKEAGYILRKIINDNAEGNIVSVDICRLESLVNVIGELRSVKENAEAQQVLIDEIIRTT